jgi:hypothetical protein
MGTILDSFIIFVIDVHLYHALLYLIDYDVPQELVI